MDYKDIELFPCYGYYKARAQRYVSVEGCFCFIYPDGRQIYIPLSLDETILKEELVFSLYLQELSKLISESVKITNNTINS